MEEGIPNPVLLGNPDKIRALADELELNLEGIRLVDHTNNDRLSAYVEAYWQRRNRRGVTREEAARIMRGRNYFAAMMVATGDADGFVSGIARSYPETIRPALEIIGTQEGVRRVAGAYLVILEDGIKIFADTTVNIDPSAEDLAEIAEATAAMAEGLDIEPHIAMLSYSNFGSNRSPQALKVAKAVQILRERSPQLDVDGEMQVGAALDVLNASVSLTFVR